MKTISKKSNPSELRQNMIGSVLDEVTDGIVNNLEWQDYKSSPLGSVIPAAKVRDNFKSFIQGILYDPQDEKRVIEGLNLIVSNLHRLSNESQCREELRNAASQIFAEVEALLEKKEVKTEEKVNGTERIPSLADLWGISYASLTSFYILGNSFWKEKQVEKGLCIFKFLTTIQPFVSEFWVSEGMCHQFLEEWFSSAYCYSIASMIKPDDILPYIYCAECMISLGDRENAKETLEEATKHLTPENKLEYEQIIHNLLLTL